MPTFIKDGSASSLAVRMAPNGGGDSALHLPKAGGEQISTYIEAVNYLLKSYTTDANIFKATSEVANLRKARAETSVQFAEVLRDKVVRCGNAYPEERTKRIFIERLLSNIQSAVRMFRAREREDHLSKLAQCADTLLELTRQTPASLTPKYQKSRYD